MGNATTLEITGELYKRVERLAAWRDQTVIDALQEMLTVAENRIALLDEDAQMDFEEAAYEIQHKELFERFAGEYVAIHKGKLVDHDADELALYFQINERYPHDIVLLKRCGNYPNPICTIGRPALIESNNCMAQFSYDSSYYPAAPVMEIGVGIPKEKHPRHYLQVMVDSGADATMFPSAMLTEIGARFVGHKILSRITGQKDVVRLYLVVIHMPTGITYGIRAVARDGQNEAILGRDVLNQWRITLDGPGETVEIQA